MISYANKLCPAHAINFDKILLYFKDTPFIMPDETVSRETKRKWLLELCQQVVEKHVDYPSEISGIVEQTIELGYASDQPYCCRSEGCDREYVYHSARVRCVHRV